MVNNWDKDTQNCFEGSLEVPICSSWEWEIGNGELGMAKILPTTHYPPPTTHFQAIAVAVLFT